MAIQPVQFARAAGGWQEYVEHYPEGTSQSWGLGQLVVFSSGKLIKASTNTVTTCGISLYAASGTASTDTAIIVPLKDVVVTASVDGALSTNAPNTKTPNDLTIGAQYGWSLDAATGRFYVDSANTNYAVTYLGAVTDQGAVLQGLGYFRFMGTATAWV